MTIRIDSVLEVRLMAFDVLKY